MKSTQIPNHSPSYHFLNLYQLPFPPIIRENALFIVSMLCVFPSRKLASQLQGYCCSCFLLCIEQCVAYVDRIMSPLPSRYESLGCPESYCSMLMGYLCCIDNWNFQRLGSQEGAVRKGVQRRTHCLALTSGCVTH